MVEKESTAQEVSLEFFLGKYEEEQRSVFTDVRVEQWTYEHVKDRYWHIVTLILFSYLILKWVEKVFWKILSSHRYEKLLCEAERDVGRLQVIVDAQEEQERLEREAEEEQERLEREAEDEQERLDREAEDEQERLEREADESAAELERDTDSWS